VDQNKEEINSCFFTQFIGLVRRFLGKTGGRTQSREEKRREEKRRKKERGRTQKQKEEKEFYRLGLSSSGCKF